MKRQFAITIILALSQSVSIQPSSAQSGKMALCKKALEQTVKTCSRSRIQSADKLQRCVIEAMTRQQFVRQTHYDMNRSKMFECLES